MKQKKNPIEKLVSAEMQNQLHGRRIELMKINDCHDEAMAAATAGVPVAEAVRAALEKYSEVAK